MEVETHLLAALRALIGVAVVLGLAVLLSSARRKIDPRVVIGGLVLQLVLAFLVLQAEWFRPLVSWVASIFVVLLQCSAEGAKFVFGPLAVAPGEEGSIGMVFACQILPTVIFISALTSVLYYLGIMQRIVFGVAWVMRRAMRLSGAESLAAAANVFVGQTEAPLVIKPYIPTMTRSELMALMVGGMATIAGGVLAAYMVFLGGGDQDAQREFATLLLCASLMNAPAALLIAKIMVPETGEVDESISIPRDRAGSNVLDALAKGTSEGLKLALNVAAMLIVFVAAIALVDSVLGWIGGWSGLSAVVERMSDGGYEELSLGAIAGYLFAPIAWAIGIGSGDTLQVGQLLGTKMVLNEFVGYLQLGEMREAGSLSARSIYITTFALCGFANFSSIGIQLGGIGVLAPERRVELATLGFRAMLGGTLASLLSAAIAGAFFVGS